MRHGRGEPRCAGDSTAAQHCVEGNRRTGPPLRICRWNGETVRHRLGGKADFSYWQCYEGPDGPIAQLDRVTDFYSVGCRFESCWDRQRLCPWGEGQTFLKSRFSIKLPERMMFGP